MDKKQKRSSGGSVHEPNEAQINSPTHSVREETDVECLSSSSLNEDLSMNDNLYVETTRSYAITQHEITPGTNSLARSESLFEGRDDLGQHRQRAGVLGLPFYCGEGTRNAVILEGISLIRRESN